MLYPVIQKEGRRAKSVNLEYYRLSYVFKVHNSQAWDRTKGRCHTVAVMLPLHRLAGRKRRHSLPMEKTSTRSIFAEDPIDPPPPPKEGKGGEEGEGVIIPYWRGVEHKWPELARFAYDVQSIPAMSTECERCFSSGSKTIGGRWTLDGESIEACEVSGAVDLTSIRLDSHNYPPVMLGHRSIPTT